MTDQPLQQSPLDIDQHIAQAAAHLEKKEPQAALNLLLQILDKGVAHPRAIQLLGAVAEVSENYDAILGIYHNLQKAHPENQQLDVYIGYLHYKKGEHQKAVDHIKKAPNMTFALTIYQALGECYMFLGDSENALRNYEQALEIAPDNPNTLYAIMRFYHKVESLDDSYMQRLLALVDTPMENYQKSLIHTSLFKAYQDLRDYDTAFTHAEQAATLRRQDLDYNAEKVLENHDTIKAYFCQEFFDQEAPPGNPSEKPVFVLGAPRSGTTLMEQILHAHPDIEGIGEDTYLSTMIMDFSHMLRFKGLTYPLRINAEDKRYMSVKDIADNYITYIESKAPGKKRIINKAMGNWTNVGFFKLAFPSAKFIHITRNVMDCGLSCFTTNFGGNAQPYSYDLQELGQHYSKYIDVMNHWKSLFKNDILHVRYEDIVENTEQEARRMIDFLDLPWDERCLAFHAMDKAVHTASVTQVRQPIYKSAVQRWKRYEKHLKPLKDALDPPEILDI